MGVIRLKILNRIAKITFVIILENIMNFKKHFQILNLLNIWFTKNRVYIYRRVPFCFKKIALSVVLK